MRKLNCWEFKKCGKEPGGAKSEECGVCPAATEAKLDNVNYGKNGGRACWGVTGTLCHKNKQLSFVHHVTECTKCDFYHLVNEEEDWNYHDTKAILKKLACACQ